jgi:hypothetical protein
VSRWLDPDEPVCAVWICALALMLSAVALRVWTA